MLKNIVGRKLVMAATGLPMAAFAAVHLLGNASLYYGPDAMNSYARALHRFSSLIWAFRLFMLSMLSLHVFYGIRLTLENRAAKPQGYAVKKNLESTFASRNMIWTGLLTGAFIVYHLLHFTFQVTNPELAAGTHPDAMGRPDVFTMVVLSFRKIPVSAVYVFAMGMLGLHLSHSIQSMFQTTGLNSERTFPFLLKAGTIAAIIISLGFAAFPVAVLAGLLK